MSAFTRAIERSTSGNELRGIRADVRASIKDIRGVAGDRTRPTPLGRAGEDEDAAAAATTTTTRAREDADV